MTKFKTIIFDLDGTLVDSSRDVASAVNHVRTHYGAKPLTVHQVIASVGSGVWNLVERLVVRDTSAGLEEAQGMLIRYYEEHFLDESTTYPGIPALLESLTGNYLLSVATNKPVDISKQIIKALGMEKTFCIVAGPETAGKEKPDPAMLVYIASGLEVKPNEVIMVGDSPIDVEAAKKFGCSSCAVTWGFNTPEIIRELKPDFVINDPLDLLNYL